MCVSVSQFFIQILACAFYWLPLGWVFAILQNALWYSRLHFVNKIQFPAVLYPSNQSKVLYDVVCFFPLLISQNAHEVMQEKENVNISRYSLGHIEAAKLQMHRRMRLTNFNHESLFIIEKRGLFCSIMCNPNLTSFKHKQVMVQVFDCSFWY